MNVNGQFVQPSGVCDLLHNLTLSCGAMTGRGCSKELHARLSVGVSHTNYSNMITSIVSLGIYVLVCSIVQHYIW